jgi:hypothetical protein
MPRGSSGRDLRVKAGLQAGGGGTDKAHQKLDKSLAAAQTRVEQVLNQVDSSTIKVASANDFYKVVVASAALVRSRVELERWQAEKMGFLSEAAEMLSAEIRMRLASRPDLIEQIRDVIGAATEATRQNLLPTPEDAPPPG